MNCTKTSHEGYHKTKTGDHHKQGVFFKVSPYSKDNKTNKQKETRKDKTQEKWRYLMMQTFSLSHHQTMVRSTASLHTYVPTQEYRLHKKTSKEPNQVGGGITYFSKSGASSLALISLPKPVNLMLVHVVS